MPNEVLYITFIALTLTTKKKFWERLGAYEITCLIGGDIPRIELFARQAADGWDCWGNEAPED